MENRTLFFLAATEHTDVTWLARMVGAHPQAACPEMGNLASKLLARIAGVLTEFAHASGESDAALAIGKEERWAIERTALAAVFSRYAVDDVRAIGNATAMNIRHLHHLHDLLPEAKFVVVVRDGRRIAAEGWEDARKRRPNPQFAREFVDHVHSTAHFWRRDVQSAGQFARDHANDCLIVRFEDLTNSPEAIVARVLKLLGLSHARDTVQACVAAAGSAPSIPNAAPGAAFDDRAHETFLKVAREALQDMNYSFEFNEIQSEVPRPAAPAEDADTVAEESTLRTAAEKDAQDPKAQFQLAYHLWRRGRLGEALPLLERTLELAPENHFAANVLTMTLSRLGRTEDAISMGQRALTLKDKAARAFFESKPALTRLRTKKVAKPFSENPKNNVISFSLWGDNPMYTEGAALNVEIARYMYPCWTCRFYVDETVPKGVLDRLRALGAQVIHVPPEERGPHGGSWRFFAADDTSIDRFISRDCDSRLNTQERMAVDEWIASGKAVHIMRDHVWHNELILAGLWGAVTGSLPPLKPLIVAGRWFGKSRWYDQFFLGGVVWPLAREDHLAHDTYFRLGNARAFPAVGRLPSTSHVGGTVRNV